MVARNRKSRPRAGSNDNRLWRGPAGSDVNGLHRRRDGGGITRQSPRDPRSDPCQAPIRCSTRHAPVADDRLSCSAPLARAGPRSLPAAAAGSRAGLCITSRATPRLGGPKGNPPVPLLNGQLTLPTDERNALRPASERPSARLRRRPRHQPPQPRQARAATKASSSRRARGSRPRRTRRCRRAGSGTPPW